MCIILKKCIFCDIFMIAWIRENLNALWEKSLFNFIDQIIEPEHIQFYLEKSLIRIQWNCRAIAQAVSRRLATAAARVKTQIRLCGICCGQNGTGTVFFEYFSFPCQFSFHRLLHIHHHLPFGTSTIGQLMADVPSGLSFTPHQETKQKKSLKHFLGLDRIIFNLTHLHLHLHPLILSRRDVSHIWPV
jgi:hypothetical protein